MSVHSSLGRSYPLLICSAIEVSAPLTSITNTGLRSQLLIDALLQWRRVYPALKVVVCDGSNADLSTILKGYPDLKDVELLSFQNDREEVKRRGKGFGEGQIILHALQNSKTIGDAPGFFKCTSKMSVRNFPLYLSSDSLVGGLGFSFIFPKRRLGLAIDPLMVDTRFYATTKSFYLAHLADAHKSVNDLEGFYLEHAYLKSLRACHIRLPDLMFKWQPEIEGTSGTHGVKYVGAKFPLISEAKYALRRLLFGIRSD